MDTFTIIIKIMVAYFDLDLLVIKKVIKNHIAKHTFIIIVFIRRYLVNYCSKESFMNI